MSEDSKRNVFECNCSRVRVRSAAEECRTPGAVLLVTLRILADCLQMFAPKHPTVMLGFCLLMTCVGSSLASQSNWPAWRGAQNDGSVASGEYPVKWDASSVRWKAPLPGKGCSTPVIWNHQIFLTAPSNGLDAALAFDWDGKLLWQTTFGKENTGRHRNGSGSNPSPATDGSAVFVTGYSVGTSMTSDVATIAYALV